MTLRPKPLLLALGITLCAVNIWTGAPLLAIWVGSRIQGASGGASMSAVFVVVAVLAIAVLGLVTLVNRLSAAYDEATGRPARRRRTSPWLRSMRGEREDLADRRAALGVVERILILTVVLGVVAFEVWFFFFSGSSLPSA